MNRRERGAIVGLQLDVYVENLDELDGGWSERIDANLDLSVTPDGKRQPWSTF